MKKIKNIVVKCLFLMYKYFNHKHLRVKLFKLINRMDDLKHTYKIKIMKMYHNIEIGEYSYGCFKTDGTIEPGTKIGKFCSFAPGIRIGGLNHPTTWITTHPILYNDIYGLTEDINVKSKPVIIEDDVWIGFNAIILGGVKIGKGAVIAAGSIVTKDVEPYCIVAGNPAKTIKYRFSNNLINKVRYIDWCNWDEDKIRENIDLFKNPDIFVKEFSI